MRTNTPDFAEYAVPFTTLAEMVKICSAQPSDAVLQHVLIGSIVDDEPCVLTLSFVAAHKGIGSTNFLCSVVGR